MQLFPSLLKSAFKRFKLTFIKHSYKKIRCVGSVPAHHLFLKDGKTANETIYPLPHFAASAAISAHSASYFAL